MENISVAEVPLDDLLESTMKVPFYHPAPPCCSFPRACLHGGGRPQVGEVTCGGSPHLSCKRDHIKMREYMDRRVTPPKRVTSPTWGPPPPCKQALRPAARKSITLISGSLTSLYRWVKNAGESINSYRLYRSISSVSVTNNNFRPQKFFSGNLLRRTLFN